jgi:hypothetical protein
MLFEPCKPPASVSVWLPHEGIGACTIRFLTRASASVDTLFRPHTSYSPPLSLIASVHFLGMAIGIIPGYLANKRVLLKPLTRVLSLLEPSTRTPGLIHRPLFALCILRTRGNSSKISTGRLNFNR